jgi:hypothetical protein
VDIVTLLSQQWNNQTMSGLVLYFQDVPDNKPNAVGRQIEIYGIFVLQYIAATLL